MEVDTQAYTEANEIATVGLTYQDKEEASASDEEIIVVVEEEDESQTSNPLVLERSQGVKKGRKPKFPRKIPKQSPLSGNHHRLRKYAAAFSPLQSKLESRKPPKKRRTGKETSSKRNVNTSRRSDRAIQPNTQNRKAQKQKHEDLPKKERQLKKSSGIKLPDEETLPFCEACLIGFCNKTALEVHVLESHVENEVQQSTWQGYDQYEDEEPLKLPFARDDQEPLRLPFSRDYQEPLKLPFVKNYGVDDAADKEHQHIETVSEKDKAQSIVEPKGAQCEGSHECSQKMVQESSTFEGNNGQEGWLDSIKEGQESGNLEMQKFLVVLEGRNCASAENINEQNNNTTHEENDGGKNSKLIFTCGECTRRFYRKFKLAKHIGKHLKGKLTRCPQCPKEFPGKKGMDVHIRSHLEDKPFKCDICLKGFTVKSYLKRHKLMHTRQKMYFQCSECDEQFYSKSALRRHFRIHSNKRSYKCFVCQKVFKTKKSFEEHFTTHGEDVLPYPCQICDKSFRQRNNLTHHMRSHSGVKPYQCSECDQQFVSRQTFRAHMARHAGVLPYVCKICDKRFLYSSSLLKHLPKHSEEKRFSCDQCGAGFYHRYHLQRHFLVHKKDSEDCKVFKCTICEQEFNVESNLKQHVKLKHLKEKRFFCEQCGKGFLHKCYLKNHSKVHQKKTDLQSSMATYENKEDGVPSSMVTYQKKDEMPSSTQSHQKKDDIPSDLLNQKSDDMPGSFLSLINADSGTAPL